MGNLRRRLTRSHSLSQSSFNAPVVIVQTVDTDTETRVEYGTRGGWVSHFMCY